MEEQTERELGSSDQCSADIVALRLVVQRMQMYVLDSRQDYTRLTRLHCPNGMDTVSPML